MNPVLQDRAGLDAAECSPQQIAEKILEEIDGHIGVYNHAHARRDITAAIVQILEDFRRKRSGGERHAGDEGVL